MTTQQDIYKTYLRACDKAEQEIIDDHGCPDDDELWEAMVLLAGEHLRQGDWSVFLATTDIEALNWDAAKAFREAHSAREAA